MGVRVDLQQNVKLRIMRDRSKQLRYLFVAAMVVPLDRFVLIQKLIRVVIAARVVLTIRENAIAFIVANPMEPGTHTCLVFH